MNMRAPGMTAHRTPLFAWAVFITTFFTSFSRCNYYAFNW
jgi:heme/copper-type cytochrome/quinol oxidase subunit 1